MDQPIGTSVNVRPPSPDSSTPSAVTTAIRSPSSVVVAATVCGGDPSNTNHPALRLVTCGGVFDPHTRSYLANIVVFAALTAVHPAGA